MGLSGVILAGRVIGLPRSEAPLRRADAPWLGLVALAGGMAGPLLLMLGLSRTPASAAALLLNIEGLATMGIAWMLFRENVDRRLLLGAAAILAGALMLSWQGGPGGVGLGALAIVGACLAWGDRQQPDAEALVSGPRADRRAPLPSAGALLGAGLVGFFGYGVSLVLFVLALHHLGAARTGAYFSTAPFLGAVLSLALFREPVTAQLAATALLMALGVYLHLSERHEHQHAHEAMDHEHRHVHDDHHQHAHGPDDPPSEPHTHWHRHAPSGTSTRIFPTSITGTGMPVRPWPPPCARPPASTRADRRRRALNGFKVTLV